MKTLILFTSYTHKNPAVAGMANRRRGNNDSISRPNNGKLNITKTSVMHKFE